MTGDRTVSGIGLLLIMAVLTIMASVGLFSLALWLLSMWG